MLDGRDGLSVLGLVLMDLAMPHQLFAGCRVLAFREPGELLGSYRSGRPNSSASLPCHSP